MKKIHSKKTKAVALGLTACALCATLTIGSGLTFGTRAFADDTTNALKKYYTDYESYEAALAAGEELNEEIVAESMILLKNTDKYGNEALPLNKGGKISVFGVRSNNLQAGGSGSGSSGGIKKTLWDSLDGAGFKLNPKLRSIYQAQSNTNEVGPSLLVGAEDSYKLYNDGALIIISRTGSEFNDNGVYNVTGHSDKTDHSQMLTDAEKELIEHVKKSFDNITLIINGPNVVELGAYEDDEAISGIIWAGLPGPTGIMALGRVLNGEVNPSGKTVDVWMANLRNDPSYQNFRDNSQWNNGTASTTIVDKDGTAARSSYVTYQSLDYAEGIYMGYRWYETAAVEKVGGKTVLESLAGFDAEKAGKYTDAYYNRSTGVVYPFGYGLSYTNFQWELVNTKTKEITSANDKITVQVKVTNTGSVAGKDVVELYSTPQYYAGGIEKAAVNLVDFQKTKLLQPGKSQTLTFEVTPWDLAAFDDVDANGNGFIGYELEAGKLTLSLRSDSHNVKDGCAVDYTVKENTSKTATKGKTGLMIENDPVTGTKIEAWFSKNDIYNTRRTASVMEDGTKALTFTSRADMVGTFPHPATVEERTFKQDIIDYIKGQEFVWSYEDKATDPWYKTKADIPAGWTQAGADEVAKRVNGKTATQLIDMMGVEDEAAWTAFMNQLTLDELKTLASSGRYQTVALASIGKDQATDQDGPAQLKGGSGGTSWCCEVNIASTWNVELAEKQGLMVGNDSLFIGTTGWYGPAMNTHRTPTSGRNFEYYSQDGIQGGKIAAAVVRGARAKGVHVYIKHFALNDQETNRYNVCTWATEQAMRENYLKQFELAVKEGDADGTMAAFNLIGLNSTANYRLYQNILRNEWGFEGASVTDMYGTRYLPSGPGNLLVRNFIFPLGTHNNTQNNGRGLDGTWSEELNCVTVATSATDNTQVASYTQWYAIRMTAQTILQNAVKTNLMKNGVTAALTGDTTLTGKVGTSFNKSVAVTEGLNGGAVEYTISSGALPAGITLSKAGVISGSPTAVGTFNFTVKLTVDGWVTKTASYRITVAPSFTAETGKEFSEAIGTYKVGDPYNGNSSRPVLSITSTTVTGDEIPGLAVDAEGKLTGVPTTPGTYNITVSQNGTYRNGSRTSNFSNARASYVIVVTGEAVGTTPETSVQFRIEDGALQYSVDGETWVAVSSGSGSSGLDGVGISKIEKTSTEGLVDTYTITLTNGTTTTFTVTNGAQGAQGEKGETGAQGEKGETGAQGPAGPAGQKGETGAQGPAGAAGKDGKDGVDGKDGAPGKDGKDAESGSGCNGSVVSTSIVCGAVLLTAALVLVLRKRKENN